MKAILAILALAVVANAMTDRDSWAYFKNKHQKSYPLGEETRRFQIFTENLRKAEKLHANSDKAIFGITKFMDLTPDEFTATHTNLNSTAHSNWVKSLPHKSFDNVRKASGNVDWRGKAVASVKDQETCGGCWAFSAAAAMEGCMMLKNGGKEVDVSAQQIIDCCHAGGSVGCNGGFPDKAVNWAVSENLATWDSYPFIDKDGTCKKVTEVAVPSGTCKYVGIAANEKALQSAIENGPVSIALDATVLQYYYGGIISGSECDGTDVDHAVLMVAWEGTTYTVKNSWGEDWGEAGYFRCAANVNCMSLDGESSMALPK